MNRVRSVSEAEIETLAEGLGLHLRDDEVPNVADRVNVLLDFYRDLDERAPTRGDSNADRFDATSDHVAADDPHNAWLSRFDLSRPDAEGVLSGLDVAVKDNVCVRGVEMTNGSRAFEGFAPANHAEVVERLLDAGAHIVGKTNMDELAFGPTSETSAFGPTENPAAEGHVAGGSSSGSAAAVASGDVDLAIGSDTGGSIRIPASYCGIVGVKPTYGRVPRYGFAPLAYSMDHVGPLASDVETAARGLDVLADPAPGASETGYAEDLGRDLGSSRIGVPECFFEQHVTERVERTVRRAIRRIEEAGATIVDVPIPGPAESRAVWWGIAPPEFAATYATNASGFFRRERIEPSLAAAVRRLRAEGGDALGANVKAMLSLGAYLNEDLGGYHYVRARNRRAELVESFEAALDDVDVLATPATPTSAPEIGGFVRGESPPVNWNTHPTNLSGHPSVSVPCGDAEGCPVGLQFVAPWHEEGCLLDVAYEYERVAKQ